MKKKKITAKNTEETKKFARSFVEHLIKKGPAKKEATIIGLYGDLGAGKTFFTKEAAKILGVKESVASPTFVLERIYKLPLKNKFEHLIHIDAYRLESGEELARLGWKELIGNSKNLIFIEWPEKVFDLSTSFPALNLAGNEVREKGVGKNFSFSRGGEQRSASRRGALRTERFSKMKLPRQRAARNFIVMPKNHIGIFFEHAGIEERKIEIKNLKP